MHGATLELKLFKQQEQYDSFGITIKDADNCIWNEVEEYSCVVFSTAKDELQLKNEMEHNVEIGNFWFESQDQQSLPPQVQKNDYVAFTLPTLPDATIYTWKVKSVRAIPTFVFSDGSQCLTYHLITERVEPRECIAPNRSLILSEGISVS